MKFFRKLTKLVADAKVTPIDADVVLIQDSTASNEVKSTTWANIKATLKTYNDTLYVSKTTVPWSQIIACSDLTTALTTGTIKAYFPMDRTVTLTGVKANVLTAPTGGTLLTIDINENGTTILSTKLTFDASEKTTLTATAPAVISDSTLTVDSEISIDIDAVGSTIAGAGLTVTLIGTTSI